MPDPGSSFAAVRTGWFSFGGSGTRGERIAKGPPKRATDVTFGESTNRRPRSPSELPVGHILASDPFTAAALRLGSGDDSRRCARNFLSPSAHVPSGAAVGSLAGQHGGPFVQRRGCPGPDRRHCHFPNGATKVALSRVGSGFYGALLSYPPLVVRVIRDVFSTSWGEGGGRKRALSVSACCRLHTLFRTRPFRNLVSRQPGPRGGEAAR